MNELDKLLSQPGQEPLSIFAMIVRQFRLLLQAKELVETRTPGNQMASQLKVPAFVADKLVQQSQRYSSAQLYQIYQHLLELDIAMKSGSDPATTLDRLVASLTAG